MSNEKGKQETTDIAHEPVLGEWLVYPENKPKNDTFVLATVNTTKETWVEIVGYSEGYFQLPGRGKTTLVTHWMPLPEPAFT